MTTTATKLTTVIHVYRFDLKVSTEAKAWNEVQRKLKKTHSHCMESHGGALHYRPELSGQTVELESKHLFDNQWNSTAGRIFDWALDYKPYRNPNIKQGYWIEQTPEMSEVRNNTAKCGYCGHQEPAGLNEFCPECLGSQYLKAEDLKLTRMLKVSKQFGTERKELTDSELAERMPLYIEAQTVGRTERDKRAIAKERLDIVKEFEEKTQAATTKRDGMLWLMDNGLRTDNVIYYSHTDTFCFGWRTPLSGELLNRVLDIISEFPFKYEIKKSQN